VVDWCLMGYGGYGVLSVGVENARNLCGWSRRELGWIEAVDLTDFVGDIVMEPLEVSNQNSLFLLPIDMSVPEYFLLEYRRPQGTNQFGRTDSDFSPYLWPLLTYGPDPLEEGLLIMHIDESMGSGFQVNLGTPLFPHYRVAVEDVGYNPDRDHSTNPLGYVTDSAMWWYPYETRKAAPFTSEETGKEVFGPTSYPNSDGYSASTGIVVRVDSMVNERLYANVKVPRNDWRVDIESIEAVIGAPATVGVTAYWPEAMSEMNIPLVVRSIDGGAMWSGILPVDTVGASPSGVS